jgi:acyl dehydratase
MNLQEVRFLQKRREGDSMSLIQRIFSEVSVGMRASLSRKLTREDVERFADVTGDRNPIHVDEEYAGRSHFGRTIAHGMFGASLISAVLGTDLPGPGALYMEQSLRFRKPVFIGDTLTATVEITALYSAKNQIRLSTICTNQTDDIVIAGEAVLHLKP